MNLTTEQDEILNEALNLKEASVKRAMKASNSKFKMIYEDEIALIAALRAAFAEERKKQK